ncbi:hypothetical protein [Saccharopolyspora taberi]|uniref:hypothetical protein n=1 Tax=Saccharopolyspora taberi TaxID=60895 RepID=UPI0031DBFAF4
MTEQDKTASERRRRLAEIFGDVLPETTSDERPERPPASNETERWYRENRPPHHDGR